MDTKEANAQKGKILSGDIIGLDEIIDCNTDDIDNLIANLKQTDFEMSEKIEVVQGNLVK